MNFNVSKTFFKTSFSQASDTIFHFYILIFTQLPMGEKKYYDNNNPQTQDVSPFAKVPE